MNIIMQFDMSELAFLDDMVTFWTKYLRLWILIKYMIKLESILDIFGFQSMDWHISEHFHKGTIE